MKHKLYFIVTYFIAVLFLGSCKKSEDPEIPAPEIDAMLQSGTAKWSLGQYTLYYYDSNNALIRTVFGNEQGNWQFYKGQSYLSKYIDYNTTKTINYTVTKKGDKKYLSVDGDRKYEIINLTDASGVIYTTTVDDLTFPANGKLNTADHATKTITITKY